MTQVRHETVFGKPVSQGQSRTLGGAECLSLQDRIGNFAIGKEADCVVLDFAATPVLDRRAQIARTLEERLFALMILGDDRAVAATYVMGRAAWRR